MEVQLSDTTRPQGTIVPGRRYNCTQAAVLRAAPNAAVAVRTIPSF